MTPCSQQLHGLEIWREAELFCAHARRCHYRGRLASNNAIFDSSYERGRPLSFKIGVRQVIAGDALTEMACSPYPASWHIILHKWMGGQVKRMRSSLWTILRTCISCLQQLCLGRP